MTDPPLNTRRIVSVANQLAVFADGTVDGVPASILVDTGSAVTIVHRRVWERGQAGSSKLRPVAGGPVVVANGEPLQILGQAQSHIHLAGGDFTHNVLVTGDVSQDCLLGADFLASHGFVIDLQSRELRQGQSSTPLLHQPGQYTSSRSVCRVSVSDTVIVRAGEEKLLFASVDNSPCSHLAGTAGVLEPKEGFEERHQLLLARVVATPDRGMVPLRVANLSASAVTLYRGTNIAKFCPLSELNTVGAETAEYCEIPTSFTPQQLCHVDAQPTTASLLGIDTRGMDQTQRTEIDNLVRGTLQMCFPLTSKTLVEPTWSITTSILGMKLLSSREHADCRFITNVKLEGYWMRCSSKELLNLPVHPGHPR